MRRTASSAFRAFSSTPRAAYAQGRFLQVLEGPESAVRRLYATIRADPRHTNVETLLTTSAAERTFPNWEMGLERPGAFVNLKESLSFLQSGELPSVAESMTDVLEALDRFRDSTAQE